eukprot:Skav213528  [mRNA]  locus=scaffold1184:39278:42157:- [translate_table: standard]
MLAREIYRISSFARLAPVFAHGVRRGNASDFNDCTELNKQITAYSKAHQWAKGIEVLDEALKKGQPVNVISFGAGLAACDRSSFWQHALELFGRLERFESSNNITWNAAISACSRAKQWEHACALLDRMIKSHFQPDTITYNSSMRSLRGTGSSASRWHLAIELYSQLLKTRLLPSLTTWSTVTNICSQGNAWHVALFCVHQALNQERSFEDAVHAVHAGSPKRDNVSSVLDAASVTSVLIACARSRRWQRSVQLFADLFSGQGTVSPDVACFNAAISACERGGHWSGALLLLHQLRHGSLQPDLTSVNALLSACEKGCKWQESLDIFLVELPRAIARLKETPSPSDLMVTYTALLSALTRGAVWPAAFTILDDMQKKQLQPGPLHFASVLRAMSPAPCGHLGPQAVAVKRKLNLSVLEALRRRESMDHKTPRERCQEVTKYIVAGMETLLQKVGSDMEHETLQTLHQFRKVILNPVVSCLEQLQGSKTEEERTAALSNARLEEQFGLGSFFTGEALDKLGFLSKDLAWQITAEMAALHALRRALHRGLPAPEGSAGLSAAQPDLPDKALAQRLVVWLAYDLVQSGSERRFTMEGRPQFASLNPSSPSEEVPLVSIFVEHDRGNHAERGALLSVISDLLAEDLRPCDFDSVHGTVALYAVHTPCISWRRSTYNRPAPATAARFSTGKCSPIMGDTEAVAQGWDPHAPAIRHALICEGNK